MLLKESSARERCHQLELFLVVYSIERVPQRRSVAKPALTQYLYRYICISIPCVTQAVLPTVVAELKSISLSLCCKQCDTVNQCFIRQAK